MEKTFYVTTPIYYVNDIPHIGHAYTTIAADVLARYKRMTGHRVFFLTGTDEHGLKVEKAAGQTGEKPIQLADRVVGRFRSLWEKLLITNDDFIRTSEQRHADTVAAFFRRVEENGDIYLGSYEDWYCVPCESFWTEKQLVENKCPDCGRKVEKLKEESFFFKLSRYQGAILQYLEENRAMILPESRYNEIVSFVRDGLRDLSISRTSFSWGIPVPGNEKHIFYVWFDALLNYVTAVDFCGEGENFTAFWPADVHIIGKDILRFHAVYWPAFLMSAGLQLPRRIFAHGWWTIEGQKMSKSLGNVIDPASLADEFGVDALRYFLLREVPFGLDGDYSLQVIINRINSDLANDLGNLFSRTVSMLHKYCKGAVPGPDIETDIEIQLREKAGQMFDEVDRYMEALAFNKALTAVWEFISAVNKYIDETAPWALAKDEAASGRLASVMYHCAQALAKIAVLTSPFMPMSADKMWQALGCEGQVDGVMIDSCRQWESLKPGTTIDKIPPLFPRIQPQDKS